MFCSQVQSGNLNAWKVMLPMPVQDIRQNSFRQNTPPFKKASNETNKQTHEQIGGSLVVLCHVNATPKLYLLMKKLKKDK